jgi:hypothetical protein
MPARVVNIAVGIWLFISAFVWQHTGQEFTNTWICGVLAVVFALGAMADDRLRYLNTALGIYLFVSTLAFHHTMVATMWNNLIAAAVIFLVSLAPGRIETRGGLHRPIST